MEKPTDLNSHKKTKERKESFFDMKKIRGIKEYLIDYRFVYSDFTSEEIRKKAEEVSAFDNHELCKAVNDFDIEKEVSSGMKKIFIL